MKLAWINNKKFKEIRLFSGDYQSDNYYGLNSKSELNECDALPLISYILDPEWMDKISKNPNTPIGDLLSISKERTAFWAVKDERFYYEVILKKHNQAWELYTYGPPSKAQSDSLSNFYFKKKIQVHEVVDIVNDREFIIYIDNGVIMDLNHYGRSQLLRDKLLEIIRLTKAGNHF